MKKLLIIAGLCAAFSAQAQHRPYPHHRHYPGGIGWSWVAPTLIGGVVGYEIARNQQPVIVQQQPVIVQPPIVTQPPVVYQNCSAWTEIVNSDGTITTSRTCTR